MNWFSINLNEIFTIRFTKWFDFRGHYAVYRRSILDLFQIVLQVEQSKTHLNASHLNSLSIFSENFWDIVRTRARTLNFYTRNFKAKSFAWKCFEEDDLHFINTENFLILIKCSILSLPFQVCLLKWHPLCVYCFLDAWIIAGFVSLTLVLLSLIIRIFCIHLEKIIEDLVTASKRSTSVAIIGKCNLTFFVVSWAC